VKLWQEVKVRERVMNNYTMATADRLTHLKIVVVSLIAGIIVVGVGIAARPALPDTRLEARAPVLKADRPVVWTQADRITIR
jgi:ABC-type proline/glycine betaine transport system permease subunit